jgi:branched-chain amino acid transport system substrate-binding protein
MIRASSVRSKWLAVLLLVSGLIFFWSSLSSAASKGPIKVGLMVPLTGFAVEDGKQYSRGVNLAFEEVKWNIAGRKVELVTEDYAYNPTVAVQKIKKLFYNDKIKLVIGPSATAACLAIHPFIRENKILDIALMGTTDKLNDEANFASNWFRVSFCKQISNVAGYAAYKKGYRKAVVVVPDFVAGYDEIAGFKGVFEKMGGKVIQEIKVPLGSIDMAPYLVKVDPNADMTFAFFFGEDAPRFIKQYNEYGLKKRLPLIVHGAAIDLPYLKALGDAAEGVESTYFYCESSNIPEMQKFRKAFNDKYNMDVSYAAEAGYMAGKVLVLGLQGVNGNDEDIDKLSAAIEKLDFKSTRGRFRFGKNHNPVQDYYLRRVEKVDGKLENVVKETYPNIYQNWMPPEK